MQQTLNPGETFTINRFLENHLDTSTYYVRAVVYDAETRTALATKDLTDNGNRWFYASYKVPHDNVFGNGKRIVIITSVYTDAGYTTKSQNHGDDAEEYLIQQRWNPTVHFGGGNTGFDEKTLLKMFGELVDAKLKPMAELEPLELPDYDFEGLKSEMKDYIEDCMGRHVGGIKMPDPVDLVPLLDRLSALAQMIVERPKFKETDTTDLLNAIAETKEFLTSMREDTVRVLEEIIVTLMKENESLKKLTNGAGGTLRLEVGGGDPKSRILSRLANKYAV